MGSAYARTMFSEAAKKLQEEHHSRAQYQRLAERGPSHDALTAAEVDFIGRRDSFYLGSVTPDGWPYVQHRGGPRGFLKVIDEKTLAFADYAGNKQYISTGNVATNDRVALFLMDYPHQARLKLIGHAKVVEPHEDPVLLAKVKDGDDAGEAVRIERILVVALTAFDWNCPQFITPRYTEDEVRAMLDAHGR